MTAAEAAAQIASLSAAAQASYSAGTLTGPGVFSLDQLVSMGKANAGTPAVAATPDSYDANGNFVPGTPGTPAVAASMFTAPQINQEWESQGAANTGALISGGGNASITATGLQAGYYQVPGQAGAEYYDPHSGQASSEFVAWANSATPDALTAAFIPSEGGPQAANDANQMPAQAAANFTAEAALINGGMSNEDAQNATLGIGPNQQFVAGANGQQETMVQAMAPQTGGGERDVSTGSSKYIFVSPDGVKTFQGYWADPSAPGTPVPYADVAADTQTSEDSLNTHNQDAYAALQQERVIAAATAAGVDPGTVLKYGTGLGDATTIQNIANTGISAAQTSEIAATYARISDPAEQAAYLAAQDPGNLTPALRVAQGLTPEKIAEKNWMTKNALAPVVTWGSAAPYGDTSGGQVKTTYGDVTQTDAKTGRSVMFGNVITKMEYVAPQGRGSFDVAMRRLGGGLYGGFIGFIASFGNTLGVVAGAASGSGFLGGIKTSFKNPTGNLSKSGWGAPANPAAEGIQNVGIDLAAAALEGSTGLFGGALIGSALGFIRNNGQGGAAGAESGAISGGLAGMFGAGRQWNGGVDFRPSPAVAPGASMWTGPTV